MPAILATASISDRETERKTQELLYAFYRHHFSGVPVELAGSEQVTFPKLEKENFMFNQQEISASYSGPQIHTIFTDLRPLQVGNTSENEMVRVSAIFTIYARVRNPSKGMQSADYEARLWGDRLKLIFERGTRALGQHGMHNTRLRRGPVPVPVAGVQTRMLVVTARLDYTSAH